MSELDKYLALIPVTHTPGSSRHYRREQGYLNPEALNQMS